MSSKRWSFLFLCLFLQCWFTHLFYCNVLRRWHWDRGFIAHFLCPRLAEKSCKNCKSFLFRMLYFDTAAVRSVSYISAHTFLPEIYIRALERTNVYIVVCSLDFWEEKKSLSQLHPGYIPIYPGKQNYENDMRLIWPPAFLLWSEIQRSLSWRSNRLKSALGQAPSPTV